MQHYFSDKSLGQGKRQRTRSALIDSAIQVVAEKGYEKASIKEITQAAGLANGTFYNHFADRDSLVREAASVVCFELALSVEKELAHVENALDKVILSSDTMVEHAIAQPTWGKIVIGALHHIDDFQQDVTQILRRDLKRAKRQGHICVTINRFLEAQLISLMALSISTQIRHGGSRAVRHSTAEGMLRLLGIASDTAHQQARRILNR